jgi:hypothetical protein
MRRGGWAGAVVSIALAVQLGTIGAASAVAQPSTVTLQFPGAKVAGDPVVMVATVASGIGPAPTGSVVFSDSGQRLAEAPLQDGTAELHSGLRRAGSHTLTVTYGGDDSHAPAAVTETVTLQLHPIWLELRPGAMSGACDAPDAGGPRSKGCYTKSAAGEAMSFTAVLSTAVSGAPSYYIPAGPIRFSANGHELAVMPLYGTTTVWTPTVLPPGMNVITASIAGDETFNPAYAEVRHFYAAGGSAAPTGTPPQMTGTSAPTTAHKSSSATTSTQHVAGAARNETVDAVVPTTSAPRSDRTSDIGLARPLTSRAPERAHGPLVAEVAASALLGAVLLMLARRRLEAPSTRAGLPETATEHGHVDS